MELTIGKMMFLFFAVFALMLDAHRYGKTISKDYGFSSIIGTIISMFLTYLMIIYW